MRAVSPMEKGMVATQERAMPPKSLRLTKEAASRLHPFSTRPRLRPAPIRAPTCHTRKWA